MSLSKRDLTDLMKQNQGVVLNILPEVEFQKIHIRGSRNLPLTPDHGAFCQEVERQFGKKRFIALYGSDITGGDALEAAEELLKLGFKAGAYLGGIKGWNEAGLPMDGAEVPKPAGIPQ